MSEKSHHDNNGKSVQSVEPHQSTWFTHWAGTRYESSTHDPSPHTAQIKEHGLDNKLSSTNFRSSKGIKDTELAMSLKNPGNQSFPFFKRGQESGRSFLLNQEEKQKQALGPQLSHKKSTAALNKGSSSRDCHFQPEEASQMKYHMFFGETVFPSKNHLPKTEQEHPMPSFLRKDNFNSPLLKSDPSTSTNNNGPSPALIEEQYKRMQKHIGMGFFPHQTVHSLQNVSHLESLHSFSGTTHSLLITKQTDVKLYQEKQIFREAMVSTQQGLKLQLLDSSDQESQEKIEDSKAIENVQKNESSADTETMDMESFKENHLSGVHLSPRNKDITVESNLVSEQKDTRRKRKMEVPDINIEISPLPASSSSDEKTEPCTSRTQSLDMNTLHFNLDHTPNSRSEECSDSTNHGSEPGNRWIKRLKLTASSSLLKKNSETQKLNKFFTKITEEKPETRLDQCRRKSDIQVGESSSVKEGNDITLSHSWIRRWSRNQGQKIPVPENLKSAAEEYEKKQFPSIAAMALMGKAMTGFQSCKFQKKESFVVWNTKGFE